MYVCVCVCVCGNWLMSVGILWGRKFAITQSSTDMITYKIALTVCLCTYISSHHMSV